jgi:hypothetical protein
MPLEQVRGRLLSLVVRTSLSVSMSHCPDWKLADLIEFIHNGDRIYEDAEFSISFSMPMLGNYFRRNRDVAAEAIGMFADDDTWLR